MPTAYSAPVDDYVFLMHDVIKPICPNALAGMSKQETVEVLGQAARFYEEVWAPLDAPGDEEGCVLDGNAVRTPKAYKAGYASACEAGWNAVSVPEEFGGAGLSEQVGLAIREFSASACNSLGLYIGLTAGAQATLRRTGDDWMRIHVVPAMVAGRWAGTMCLTEPHCGTDLRLMKTKAVQQPDGTWRVTGTKIFISGGDQDLTENVIHLVLAKIPDETGKIKEDLSTVSLFMVSKRTVDPGTGRLGDSNGVTAVGVEHKMGLKGCATCALAFENCIAYKLGETKGVAGQDRKSSAGMSGMFDMMNSARLGTGLQALASASRAYGHAANYARERVAGRATKPQDRSGKAADPIIVHPDVRRLLLKQASFLEGARALALYVRAFLDETDPALKTERNHVAGVLTPVVKAYFSDRAFESANDAMQLMGGHGYIRDNGVEQLVRDARIFQLYEGANGVQAFDLAQRKLIGGEGKALWMLLDSIEQTCREPAGSEPLRIHAKALADACGVTRESANWLLDPARDPYDIGGSSYDFLTMLGIVAIAYMWLLTERAALVAPAGDVASAFRERKAALSRYWFARELPVVSALKSRIFTGSGCLMELPAEQF